MVQTTSLPINAGPMSKEVQMHLHTDVLADKCHLIAKLITQGTFSRHVQDSRASVWLERPTHPQCTRAVWPIGGVSHSVQAEQKSEPSLNFLWAPNHRKFRAGSGIIIWGDEEKELQWRKEKSELKVLAKRWWQMSLQRLLWFHWHSHQELTKVRIVPPQLLLDINK